MIRVHCHTVSKGMNVTDTVAQVTMSVFIMMLRFSRDLSYRYNIAKPDSRNINQLSTFCRLFCCLLLSEIGITAHSAKGHFGFLLSRLFCRGLCVWHGIP